MLDMLMEESGPIAAYSAMIVALIAIALWIIFLEKVPKYLKGIQEQLERMNDLLARQARDQRSDDNMKSIVKDVVKEVMDEEKSVGEGSTDS